MLTKMFRLAAPTLLAFALPGICQASDMPIDCKLKGGTVVQLSADVCKMEGGASVSGTPSSPENGNTDGSPQKNLSKLEITRKWIIDLLANRVGATSSFDKNPEGIERTARFEGCKLVVDENLHIQYGNFFSSWKDFNIKSVIDFQNINPDSFGLLGKISSKGGDLSAAAVYFEMPRKMSENSISISVINLRDRNHAKYTTHGPSPFLDAPRDDFWIADEYGYTKDNGFGDVVKETVRILLIVNSPDEATRLKAALDEVNVACKQQMKNN